MSDHSLAFVRSYVVEPWPADLSGSDPDQLPAWARRALNSRYRARGCVSAIELPSKEATIRGDSVRIRRVALTHAELAVIDVIVEIEAKRLDGPLAALNVPNPKDVPVAVDRQITSVAEIQNEVVAELAGRNPGRWPYDQTGMRRMLFGLVEFQVDGSPGTPSDGWVRGAQEGHLARTAAHRLVVRSARPIPRHIRLGYLNMAALAGRTRLLMERARAEIADLAAEVEEGAAARDIPTRAALLQARVIRERHQTAPSMVLGDDNWLFVFDQVRQELVVSDAEVAEFRESLTELNSLADTLFSVAVQDAGRRASVFGVVFASLSVAFGTIAAVELARTQNADEWVYWVAALLLAGSVITGAWTRLGNSASQVARDRRRRD